MACATLCRLFACFIALIVQLRSSIYCSQHFDGPNYAPKIVVTRFVVIVDATGNVLEKRVVRDDRPPAPVLRSASAQRASSLVEVSPKDSSSERKKSVHFAEQVESDFWDFGASDVAYDFRTVGLKNKRLCCFANASLQVLFHMRELHDALLGELRTTSAHSERIDEWMQLFWRKHSRTPSSVLKTFTADTKALFKIGPHDAQEFLTIFVDDLIEKGVYASTARSKIKNIFFSQIRWEICCAGYCAKGPLKGREPMLFVNIDLPQNSDHVIDVQNGMEEFFKPEDMDMNYAFRCGMCDARNAVKQFFIAELTDYLFILVKRFAYDAPSKQTVVKKNKLYINPVIDVGRYCRLDKSVEGIAAYFVYAVICYAGDHYFAIILDEAKNRWFKFDDSKVSEVAFNSINEREPYILVYKRV